MFWLWTVDLVALLILSRLGSAPDSVSIIGLSGLGPVSVWAHAPGVHVYKHTCICVMNLGRR